MKFTTNKIKDNEIEVIINASSEKFAEYIEKSFKEQVKEVEADGFRKGKMPKNTFIKKYGIERLYPEAIDILLNEQYKVLLEKFNSKYENLSTEQKQVLKEFINAVDSTPGLRDFYNSKINELKNQTYN